jgi:hypothetical protein
MMTIVTRRGKWKEIKKGKQQQQQQQQQQQKR